MERLVSSHRRIAWSTAVHDLRGPPRTFEDFAARKARQCVESLVRFSRPALLNVDRTFNKERIARLAADIARHQRSIEPQTSWPTLMSSCLRRAWSEAQSARGLRPAVPRLARTAPRASAIEGQKPGMPVQFGTPNPLSPKAVMAEAWRIFRETYNYPYVSFRSIGRRCFASALKQAWARARDRVRLISLGRDALLAELDRLRGERALLDYSLGRWADETRAGIRQQERKIEAALALCPDCAAE